MHNAAFHELRLGYSYSLYDLEEKDLAGFMESCRADFIGLNVTIPHKLAVIKHLDSLDKEAQLIGAVNTVKFEGGKALGYNTDGIGFIRSLQEASVPISGKRFLILGAGGASRAISFALVTGAAQVCLANRDKKKAEALASDVEEKTGKAIHVVEYDVKDLAERLKNVDVLVNTTPVGMHPATGETVIPSSIIPKGIVVADIVYNPLETVLLKEAAMRGCRTVNGAGMLVHQGAQALRIWLDTEPPTEAMRTALLKELGKK
jgi:shikimate dehydrogenase